MSIAEKPLVVEESAKRNSVEKEKPTGHNTEVLLSFTRHSQKSSGAVAAEGGGISAAGISPGGIVRSEQFGAVHYKDRKPQKGYATKVTRTNETLEAALKGAGLKDKVAVLEEGKIDSFFAFPGAFKWSKGFMDEYLKVMAPHEAKELANPRYKGVEKSKLSPDDQERIAEIAEEPAMDWWLNFDKQKPKDAKDKDGKPIVPASDTTPSPYEIASLVGFKVNRLVNLTDRMPDGKKVDLMSVGHKTSTEAFLKYVLVLPGKKEAEFDVLKQIGGSLRPLDTWDLSVRNDERGVKKVSITIRRENGQKTEYGVDLKVLSELSEKGSEFLGEKTKKIDVASKPTAAERSAIQKIQDWFTSKKKT